MDEDALNIYRSSGRIIIESDVRLYNTRRNFIRIKVPMQRNFQVGDNNIKVIFDIASLDCESLRTNN